MNRKMLAIIILGASGLLLTLSSVLAQGSGDPLSAFSTTLFAGSGDCATCHSTLNDSAGVDVSFDSNWRASTMANAARDPLWQAKVESEILRTPSLKGAIEHKCATCHMPMAHTQAVADGTAVAIFGSGFLDPDHSLHEAAMDGVSCAICHQIGAQNLGDPSTFSGHFPIDTTTTKDRSIFGKYSDPSVNKMSGNYLAIHGPHVEDSALCATCHTLHTDAVDTNGDPVPGGANFPEQTPYQEWQHSTFGDGTAPDTPCQDCHMPAISGTAPLSKRGSSPLRSGFGKHFFTGGNSLVLAILRDHGLDLGVTASTTDYNEAISRSETMLAQDTGSLTIEEARVVGDQIVARIRATNATGHKFPTGIPLRRAWIHLILAEKEGAALLESGRPLANGAISGNNADANLAAYEPHYDLITSGSQVQVYEAIMGDANEAVTYTLLRAAAYLKDNRLLPLGFDKAGAPEDIAVAGPAQSDGDFTAGRDDTEYQVPLPGTQGLVEISADFLYQTVSNAFIQDLSQDNAAGDHVAAFVDYYAGADQTPDFVAGAAGVLQYKSLPAGWNMISAVIAPQDARLDDIFQPILADLLLVKNGNGQVYWPSMGIKQITHWQIDEGYQIYMNAPAVYSIYGAQVTPETTAVQLGAGWNLIPYLRESNMAVSEALASCSAEIYMVKDNYGSIYWPGFGVNTIGQMQPGEGYQVYMTSPCTLTYPANP